MDASGQLGELIDLAESLGIAIRRAPGDSDPAATGRSPGGALVRLKGRELLFLDTAAALADQIAVLAGALAGRDELRDRFITPEIRQLIEPAEG